MSGDGLHINLGLMNVRFRAAALRHMKVWRRTAKDRPRPADPVHLDEGPVALPHGRLEPLSTLSQLLFFTA